MSALGVAAIARAFEAPREPSAKAATNATISIMDYGAVGDGVADDSAAVQGAIEKANSLSGVGRAPIVYFPSGVYRLVSAPPRLIGAIGLRGDGPYRTYLKLDPAFEGDLFQWSETWISHMSGMDSTMDIAQQKLGASVEGLTVVGDTKAPRQQNAFVFYDRNDNVLFRDVAVHYLNGRCLYAGAPRDTDAGYLRESQFFNVQCRNAGNASSPAVEITSTGGGDASNQLYFYDIKIVFPLGVGLKIANAVTTSATRNLFFSGIMVHGLQKPSAPIAADLVVIGDDLVDGRVNNITFEGFSGNSSYDGYYTMRFSARSAPFMPFNIGVSGTITSGANGIRVDAGRALRLQFADIAVAQHSGLGRAA